MYHIHIFNCGNHVPNVKIYVILHKSLIVSSYKSRKKIMKYFSAMFAGRTVALNPRAKPAARQRENIKERYIILHEIVRLKI